MIPKTISLRNSTWNIGFLRLWSSKCYSTEVPAKTETVFDINSAEEVPRYLDEITDEEKEAILKKRLKSGLRDPHRRIINNTNPYDENMAWFHLTTRYKKRMLGRYGMQGIDVPVGVAWPTEAEIEDKLLYEKTAYPKNIQECWKEIHERNMKAQEEIRIREEKITKNLTMVGKWEKDLKAKLAKKEAEVQAARDRKARLVEEIRREFGFAIDPRDERFKLLLEQKDKEDKKRKKEAKKTERAAKFLATMMEKSHVDTSENPAATEIKEKSETPTKEKET